MTYVLPKWLMTRYCKLWAKYKSSSFTYDDAKETLESTNDKVLGVVLSNLKLKGWLKVEKNKEDARKRVYSLPKPEEIVNKIAEDSD